MLFLQSVLVIFIISSAIFGIRSEELLNNTAGDNLSSTENVFDSVTFENLQTTSNNPAGSSFKEKEFIALNLENSSATSTNLEATPDSTSTTKFEDLKDVATTPSWELIYPEQNSAVQESFLSNSPAPLTSALTNQSTELFLPKYFKVDDAANCQKFFGQCLRQVLSKVVPKLKDANNSLNMTALDPIYFNATAFQYNSGPLTGFITIRYALVYGLTTMRFKKVDFNKQADKFKARLNISVPKMTVVGSYKGDMLVNNVRVRPRGDFNVSMKSLDVDLLSLGVIFRKDEHTFLKFTKSNATTTLKDSKINATGIFPDQRLNDIVVNVANQYWRDLFNVVLPETRNNWLPILLNALNIALAMVPFDFLEMES